MASMNPTTKPNGINQSRCGNEYDVNSTRTHERARANSSGRSERLRSPTASRYTTHECKATITAAPARRARQQKSSVAAAGDGHATS